MHCLTCPVMRFHYTALNALLPHTCGFSVQKVQFWEGMNGMNQGGADAAMVGRALAVKV